MGVYNGEPIGEPPAHKDAIFLYEGATFSVKKWYVWVLTSGGASPFKALLVPLPRKINNTSKLYSRIYESKGLNRNSFFCQQSGIIVMCYPRNYNH